MARLICPILSIQSENKDTLCVEEDCAWFLPQAKKCACLIMGYEALLKAQKLKESGS